MNPQRYTNLFNFISWIALFSNGKIRKNLKTFAVKTEFIFSGIDVDFDSELKKLVKIGMLTKGENENVQKIPMHSNPNDGMQGSATL